MYNGLMELHTCLWNEVDAFDFEDDDFLPLIARFPELQIRSHRCVEDFLAVAGQADLLLTWDFEQDWYQACPRLKTIYTPAAGSDWVHIDPNERVRVIQGKFHGLILAESVLGALLYMNRRMPEMIRNHRDRSWDRNLQKDTRILGKQNVLIIGLGHIGSACAKLIQSTGAKVIGLRRQPANTDIGGVEVRSIDELGNVLPWADHVILLLPGSTGTDDFMGPNLLRQMKKGSYVYNFGRGNALTTVDLLQSLDHLGGAFLDVTDEEPLPAESPLWHHDKVMITPHSSCVCREYKSLFLDEVMSHLRKFHLLEPAKPAIGDQTT